MKFKVTKEDIDKGKRVSYSSCPIAKAICRIFPNKKIHVNTYGGITIGDQYYYYLYSSKVKEFINKFDEQGATGVKPFTFELAINE